MKTRYSAKPCQKKNLGISYTQDPHRREGMFVFKKKGQTCFQNKQAKKTRKLKVLSATQR